MTAVRPQTFAERLFARLNRGAERFETRLRIIAVVSRAIGVHKLLLLNFYPFLQKYIQPHQRDVTDVLAALIQVPYRAHVDCCVLYQRTGIKSLSMHTEWLAAPSTPVPSPVASRST